MKIRLNKFLAEAGIASRRKSDQLIGAGKVTVNGILVTELGTIVDTEKDNVSLDNKPVILQEKLVYFAVYKPIGVISTAHDESGRKSVVDLVRPGLRVYPVGRLDADSEGLMILTNDGEFTQRLTHPSFEHEKEYLVECKVNDKFSINGDQIKEKFEDGLRIGGKIMKADKVIVKTKIRNSVFDIQVTLHTGYNRQIRKMCARIGLQVTRLVRTRIAKLSIDLLGLKPGEFKAINMSDVI